MYLIFDTETTGLPKDWNLSYEHTDNWPYAVQLAWQLHDKWGNLLESDSYLISNNNILIPFEAEKVHGISTLLSQKKGKSIEEVCNKFNSVLEKAEFVVGQNIGFDINIMGAEFCRLNMNTTLHSKKVLDTCNEKSAKFCAAINFVKKGDILESKKNKFGDILLENGVEIKESIYFKNKELDIERNKIKDKLKKWQDWSLTDLDFLLKDIKKQKFPTLSELYFNLFDTNFKDAHNASADVEATARCFFEMLRTNFFDNNELNIEDKYVNEFKNNNLNIISLYGISHQNLKLQSIECYAELINDCLNDKNDELIIQNFKLLYRLVNSDKNVNSKANEIYKFVYSLVEPYFIKKINDTFNTSIDELYKLFLLVIPLSISNDKIIFFIDNYKEKIINEFEYFSSNKEFILLAKKYLELNPFFIAYKLNFIKYRNEVLIEFKNLLSDINVNDEIKALYSKLNPPFVHLHNHSQYSILQSTTTIEKLVNKSIEYQMPAVALTDYGNMYAAFIFEEYINKKNNELKSEDNPYQIIPIIGCEFNICDNHNDKKNKDNGASIVLLAKNKNGYQNLIKLSSLSYTDGYYYVPRIDKELLLKYKDDLIVLSGGLKGEISQLIDKYGEAKAEETLLWWKNTFNEDFYIEITRLKIENESQINDVLLHFSDKHQIKIIATNNTFFIDKEDSDICDILYHVKEGVVKNGKETQAKKFNIGLESSEHYFKSPDEMKELFSDIPQAIENISEIISKVEKYSLTRDVLLPAFDIPEEFHDPNDIQDGGKRGENNYLRHLTYQGAKNRYSEITDEIIDRIEFELKTIENTGYPGYFLIVQDFCRASRDMDVWVGPGRGSAAGSVVAYCIGITNIDPIKYNLLFERFLNPDRVSLPDIDIDFEDEGRGKVIDWVIEKYGSKQVAQIITYGTMAAKSAIKDAGRVLGLIIQEQEFLSKMMPNVSLKYLLETPFESIEKKLGDKPDELEKAKSFLNVYQTRPELKPIIDRAKEIEGSVRNTGIHACGVIITPDDISNFVPIATVKDTKMICTQFDNHVAENAGLLKMDFLGLKTLTTIKNTLKIIKSTKKIEIDPDLIPIDDENTYKLFQRAETVGIFQFESAGMQKYLRELKPTVFDDLIAMNALYRPGPMDYIPKFIARKHGREAITYDIEDCEEYLKETYGVTVYQEQVMLLSQKLANFTKGDADKLRKAMGKKQAFILEKMKPQFIESGMKNGHPKDKLEKIWSDWNSFAEYAFNKSHSTCYSWLAYQTAYLKANYPSEFMASCLSGKMNDIKEIAFLMEECKKIGINVLTPNINESELNFTVSKNGDILFGLGAIKGLSTASVDEIIKQRNEGGKFKSIFDLCSRVDLRVVNKKTLESLVNSGCLDEFPIYRYQYFIEDKNGRIFIENIIKYCNSVKDKKNSDQKSLFEDTSDSFISEPDIPKGVEWSLTEKLFKEKEVVGIYISGHPLDDFKTEILSFCKGSIEQIRNKKFVFGQKFVLAGILSNVEHKFTKQNLPFGKFTFEDYEDSELFFLFNENYLKNRHMLQNNLFVYLDIEIEKRNRTNELTYSIKKINFLENLKEDKTKGLKIVIQNYELDSILIQKLNKIFEENRGNHELKIVIQQDRYFVPMKSGNFKINVNEHVITELIKLNLDVKLID